jgi:hypothetical protein
VDDCNLDCGTGAGDAGRQFNGALVAMAEMFSNELVASNVAYGSQYQIVAEGDVAKDVFDRHVFGGCDDPYGGLFKGEGNYGRWLLKIIAWHQIRRVTWVIGWFIAVVYDNSVRDMV